MTPTAQAPGASVTVDGTGFGATQAVGIALGTELTEINQALVNSTGPYDVGLGPYTCYVSTPPIKPGSLQLETNTSVRIGSMTILLSSYQYWDNGNGTLSSTNPNMTAGTIDYAKGRVDRYFTVPNPLFYTYGHTANYTRYEYSVTPAGGITTLADGTFTASFTVPAVPNAPWWVTVIDTQGNIASKILTVDSAVPEGLTMAVMVLASTVAVIAGTRFYHKRPKLESW